MMHTKGGKLTKDEKKKRATTTTCELRWTRKNFVVHIGRASGTLVL